MPDRSVVHFLCDVSSMGNRVFPAPVLLKSVSALLSLNRMPRSSAPVISFHPSQPGAGHPSLPPPLPHRGPPGLRLAALFFAFSLALHVQRWAGRRVAVLGQLLQPVMAGPALPPSRGQLGSLSVVMSVVGGSGPTDAEYVPASCLVAGVVNKSRPALATSTYTHKMGQRRQQCQAGRGDKRHPTNGHSAHKGGPDHRPQGFPAVPAPPSLGLWPRRPGARVLRAVFEALACIDY